MITEEEIPECNCGCGRKSRFIDTDGECYYSYECYKKKHNITIEKAETNKQLYCGGCGHEIPDNKCSGCNKKFKEGDEIICDGDIMEHYSSERCHQKKWLKKIPKGEKE